MINSLIGVQYIGMAGNISNQSQEGVRRSECDEPVENLMEELSVILDMELEQYSDLLDMLHAQRRLLTDDNTGSSIEIVKRQATTVLKIKILEEARKSIVSRSIQCLDISSEKVTLAKLVALVDSTYIERLALCREQLLSLLAQLENLTESNTYLIQHELRYSVAVLRIFLSTWTEDFT